MINVNIWLTARSRSTALTRCLSTIPGTKILFEKFSWAYVLETQLAKERNEAGNDSYSYESVLEEYEQTKCEFRVIKDMVVAMKPEHYPIVLNKTSVNIFLIREPILLCTSVLPATGGYYFDMMTSVENLASAEVFYQTSLEAIKYVSANCDKPPLVVPGHMMGSQKTAARVVQAICAQMGVEFKTDFLTWKSLDSFDPEWDVPVFAKNDSAGLYTRAHASTHFEDSEERKVDREKLFKERPDMIEQVEKAEIVYAEIMKYATKF